MMSIGRDCDIETSDFQYSQLLQIISHYLLNHIDKQYLFSYW